MNNAQPALTEQAVAQRLGVSTHTLRAWRRRQMGPRYLKLGRAVRYQPEDVDAYVAEATISPKSLMIPGG